MKKMIKSSLNGKYLFSNEVKEMISKFSNSKQQKESDSSELEESKIIEDIDNRMKAKSEFCSKEIKKPSIIPILFGTETDFQIHEATRCYEFYNFASKELNNSKKLLDSKRENILELLVKKLIISKNETGFIKCLLYLQTKYDEAYKKLEFSYKQYHNEKLKYKKQLADLKQFNALNKNQKVISIHEYDKIKSGY